MYIHTPTKGKTMSATITATEILLADSRDGREVTVLFVTTPETLSGYSVQVRDDATGETLVSADVIDHPAVREVLTAEDAEIVRETLRDAMGA